MKKQAVRRGRQPDLAATLVSPDPGMGAPLKETEEARQAAVNRVASHEQSYAGLLPLLTRLVLDDSMDSRLAPFCRMIGPATQETGAPPDLGARLADAVILAQEGMDEPGLCSQLLAVYPDLTILSIAPDMTSGFMQQLCSRRRDLASVEHLDIAQTLRMAVRDPCGRPREV
jgi:hypothetical protein